MKNNTQKKEPTKDDLQIALENCIQIIEDKIALIKTKDAEKGNEFSEELNKILPALRGRSSSKADSIEKFGNLSIDIYGFMNENKLIRVEEFENDLTAFKQLFKEVMQRYSYSDSTYIVMDYVKDNLKLEFCVMNIIYSLMYDENFDLVDYIVNHTSFDVRDFYEIIDSKATRLSYSKNEEDRMRGKELDEELSIRDYYKDAIVFSPEVWRVLGGIDNRRKVQASTPDQSTALTIRNSTAVRNVENKKSKDLMQTNKSFSLFQRLLKMLGFMRQELVYPQELVYSQEPSYPLDLSEVELMPHEWFYNIATDEFLLEEERKRLKTEGRSVKEIYKPKLESVLYRKFRKYYIPFKYGIGDTAPYPDSVYKINNIFGREEKLRINGNDNIVELFKRDAEGNLRNCGKHKLNMQGFWHDTGYKSVSAVLDYLRMIDSFCGSNLEEQFCMLEESVIYRESLNGDEVDLSYSNDVEKNLQDICIRLHDHLMGDFVQNILEDDEREREEFYKRQSEISIDEGKLIADKSEHTIDMNSEKKQLPYNQALQKKTSIAETQTILENATIDSISQFISDEAMQVILASQALMDGVELKDGYVPDKKKVIYDVFKSQLENKEMMKQGNYDRPEIAIGKSSDGRIVYVREGIDGNGVNLVVRGKDAKNRSDEAREVKADEYLLKVLEFSRFIDRTIGSNTYEELQREIVKKAISSESVTSDEMTNESKLYGSMLKGYMKLSLEYIKTHETFYSEENARRIAFYNKKIEEGNPIKEDNTHPAGEDPRLS